MNLYLRNLLVQLAEELRNVEPDRIIVFKMDKDDIPIQTPGYIHTKINGTTFIEILDELK